jgi:membrane protein DedA with SNARE-associated domain
MRAILLGMHLVDALTLLIQDYGYAIVFVGTLLEGETIVALAGFASYQGYLQLPIIIPIAVIGAVLGDQAFFYFGRYKGRQFLEKRPHLARRAEKVELMFGKHHGWLIFGSRFMYGFRAIIPMAMGASKLPALRFLILNILGAIVWAIFFSCAGYLFGGAIEKFLGKVKRVEVYIIVTVLVTVLLAQLFGWVSRRFSDRAEDHISRNSGD